MPGQPTDASESRMPDKENVALKRARSFYSISGIRMSETWQRRAWAGISLFLLLLLCFPMPKYVPAYSRVLYADDGSMMSASLSEEGQWCFPGQKPVPEQFATCLRLYEDEYLAWHPGMNPVSVFKAWLLNRRRHKIVRGASTLAMQVMRMKNKDARRTLPIKLFEVAGAVKLSLLSTDDDIIRIWAEMAPFGGNTVGLQAAALRYFGRQPDQLSWAEYALLAVMPNSPAGANLIVNRELLKAKRDALLTKLLRKGIISLQECQRYISEPLPEHNQKIPQKAFHLLSYLTEKHPRTYIFETTLSSGTQSLMSQILGQESHYLQQEDIKNMAVVVVDVESNNLVAYQGNVAGKDGSFSYVDIIQSPRSYGSLLKPFLYAHVLEKGLLLPHEMIPDVPMAIGDFQPENFDKKFRGAVPMDEMVVQSLNVPAVNILHQTGLQSFYDRLQQLDVAHLNKGTAHYGLSLILGGGETSLWEISRLYKGLARNYLGKADPFESIQILKGQLKEKEPSFAFSPWPMFHTVKAMSDVSRPREEKTWSYYDGDNQVAWKTGTSYGHKDAWAVGFTNKYMVAVWVGNEGGEGRYDLTGISRAAPILFRILRSLPSSSWKITPPKVSAATHVRACKQSGKLAGHWCTETEVMSVQGNVLSLETCQWHRSIQCSEEGNMILPSCSSQAAYTDTVFVVPSKYEFYYKYAHLTYMGLPETDPACRDVGEACQILYPRPNMKLFLPKEKKGEQKDIILEAYHRNQDAILYWYDHQQFLGKTSSGQHVMQVSLPKGKHSLSITDQWGNQSTVPFEIIQ